jgi:RNA polymerase sigma-70 factor, ECF subfamily
MWRRRCLTLQSGFRPANDSEVGPLNLAASPVDCDSQRSYLSRIALAAWPARFSADCGPSDLVQQTLLRAHCGVGEFRGKSERELQAWLKKILRHVISNEVRRIRTMKRGADRRTDLPLDGFPDSSESSLTALLRTEARDLLETALKKLRPEQAAVIRLRAYHGMTISEIATKLSRSEAAIQKVWSRALETLERELRSHVRTEGTVRSRAIQPKG